MPAERSLFDFAHRVLITLLLVAAALLLWHTLQIALVLFAGVLAAIFFNRTGRAFHRWTGWPLKLCIALFLVALVLVIAGVLWAASPQIESQVSRLSQQVPESWEQTRDMLSSNEVGRWFLTHLPAADQLSGLTGGLMQRATGWAFTVFGGLISIFIIVFLGIYMAFDAHTYTQGIVRLVPKPRRDRATEVLNSLDVTLYWWLIARLCSMLIIGIGTGLGLWLLDVPLPITLGIVAAVLTFIPNIGPILSVIPALLLAMEQGWQQAVYVAILYLALQFVESYIVTPLMQRQMIAMPPGLVISAQLLMGMLAGVLGILLATPLVAALVVMVKLIYVEDGLGDEVEIEAESHNDHGE